METIKTENKVESKSPEQKKIDQIYVKLEPINLAIQKASFEVSLFFDELNTNREKEYLWDLMYDIIDRIQSAASDIDNFVSSC